MRAVSKLLLLLLLAALLLAANWHTARALNSAERRYALEWDFDSGRWQCDNACILSERGGRLRVRLLAPQAVLRVESSVERSFEIELENAPGVWAMEHRGLVAVQTDHDSIECDVAAGAQGELRIGPAARPGDAQFVAFSNAAGNAQLLRALGAQLGPRIDFVVSLGHLADKEGGDAMLREARSCALPPTYVCRARGERPLGRDLAGFEYGPYYFLLLGDFAPRADALQLEWLIAELQRRSRYAAGVFIFCNRPLLASGQGRFDNPDAVEAARLAEVFKQNKVSLIVCGYPAEPYEAPARLTGLYHSAQCDGITQIVTVAGSGETGSDPHFVHISLRAAQDGALRAEVQKVPLADVKPMSWSQRVWFRLRGDLAEQCWLLWLDAPLLLLFAWLLFRRQRLAPEIPDPERTSA